MKQLIIIFLALLFTSCNPFISKDLRRKNKCNRKLERVIKKCPELLNNDTIIDTVSVIIPEVRIDSFIVIQKDSFEIDSLVNLIQDQDVREVVKEYITNYIPFKDTITQIIDGYTFLFYVEGQNIRYEVKKPVEVFKIENETIVPVVKQIELTTLEKFLNFMGRFWWWFIIGLTLFIVLRIFWKAIKSYFP
jgi:hypothetical protein